MESDPIGLAGGLNTHGYAGHNPVVNIDPLGLVEWRGNIRSVSVGEILGGVRIGVTLTSECVDNEAYVVELSGIGAGYTFGVPFGLSGSSIRLRDRFPHPSPSNLNSAFESSFSLTGGALGAPGGISVSAIRLGHAFGLNFGGFGGYEGAIFDFHGSTELVNSTQIECGCGGH